jgi:LAO/AO transport system kinase
MEGAGLHDVWAQVLRHRQTLDAAGVLARRRQRQLIDWTWAMVRDGLLAQLRESRAVKEIAPALEQQVLDGTLTPALAAERILSALTER